MFRREARDETKTEPNKDRILAGRVRRRCRFSPDVCRGSPRTHARKLLSSWTL